MRVDAHRVENSVKLNFELQKIYYAKIALFIEEKIKKQYKYLSRYT